MLASIIGVFLCLSVVLKASGATPLPPLESITVRKYAGEVVPNSYIVKLKNGASFTQVTSSIPESHKSIKSFSTGDTNPVFNGFTAALNEEELTELLRSPSVEYIEEDGILHASDVNGLSARSPISQTNAPWNLARLSQDNPATNPPFTYVYSPVAGSGVDIYILDTGVFTGHTEFGGRARWGATFGGYPDADGNGHGTALAGIAAGTTFGVAKLANIIAVKVLSDAGSGSVADIIAGLSWVVQNVKSTGRKSVVLLALGGSPSTSLDDAVVSVINSGISVVTVAGGSNTDASNFSPARVAQAITVAASTQSDSAASFSNFGSVVDLYAPGQNVITAGIASPTATVTFSGVSMAAAHVAGLVAYLLSLTGPISPATVISDLTTMSRKNVLSGVPSGTSNRLASNDVSQIGITI